MAARNAYHKEVFELSEALRIRATTITSDRHTTGNNSITQQTTSCDQDIEQDQSALEKASTAVIMDGITHKIPTALALPLREVTFNTFARMYMQIGSQEPGKLNSTTLLKLYRTFLDTQIHDIEGELKIDAFQRVSFPRFTRSLSADLMLAQFRGSRHQHAPCKWLLSKQKN